MAAAQAIFDFKKYFTPSIVNDSWEFRCATSWSSVVFFCLFIVTGSGQYFSSNLKCESDAGILKDVMEKYCEFNIFS